MGVGNLADALVEHPIPVRRWQCLACSSVNPPAATASTESQMCIACGATWRDRVVLGAVLIGLEIGLFPLPALSPDWSRTGVGIADAQTIAAPLASRFDYVNGHLHRYPHLDVRSVPEALVGTAEFVVCSEVLEHVEPPVQPALDGLARLLRPGGFAVITVPDVGLKPPGEHYPDLVEWSVRDDHSIDWRDSTGKSAHDPDPEWHGGAGLTLAFRRWTADELDAAILAAGLTAVDEGPIYRDDLGTAPIPGKLVRLARRVP